MAKQLITSDVRGVRVESVKAGKGEKKDEPKNGTKNGAAKKNDR
jgi:hypothetical protein